MRVLLLLLTTADLLQAFTLSARSPNHLIQRGSRHVLPSAVVLSSSTAGEFDAYECGQDTLVYKDEVVGDGDDVACEKDVLCVSYVGFLYPSGKQFTKNDDFVFEIGKGKSLPGFDDGLVGVRVGGKRILRVPPKLAYGSGGASGGRVPPNADVEFVCEVKRLAKDDFQKIITKIGYDRLAIGAVLILVLAISPFLS